MFIGNKTDKAELKGIIEEGILRVLAEGKFQEYLDFHANFSRYSLSNSLLIFLACPNATFIAGKKKWEELGRSVIEGVKPIMIFAPTFRKYTKEALNENTGEVETIERQWLTGFRSVNVYDVSQTYGKEIPSPVGFCRDFGDKTELLDRFINIFGEKYRVEQKPLKAQLGGFITSDNTITLNSSKSEERRLKTLIHEVAHGELGHFEAKDKSKKAKELEAEIAAYIVSRHFGVDSSDYSFGYLVSWSKGDISLIHTALNAAHAVSSSIIEQIEAAERAQQMAS